MTTSLYKDVKELLLSNAPYDDIDDVTDWQISLKKRHLDQLTKLMVEFIKDYHYTHAHGTGKGWCCACEFDIRLMESKLAEHK